MVKNLKIENFRNHSKTELSFDKVTVLIGENGAGKSNILEAVAILSCCRSFRNEQTKNLIKNDEVYSRVTGDNLEFFFTKVPRMTLKAKENGAARKLVDFIGIIPSVVFSPETLSIVTGSPGERRRFLDLLISQFDKEYLNALIDYDKIKKQRNVLLQRILEGQSKEEELEFWDNQLIERASKINQKRAESVQFFNKYLSALYSKIAGEKQSILEIVYQPETDLRSIMMRNRQREIRSGKTLFGPHRDDLIFKLNSFDLANFASRGEIRTGIMALKLAEITFLKDQRKIGNRFNGNIEPVLLLDDIFSEFDKKRRDQLGDLVQEYQTIITTTELEHLSSGLSKTAKIIEVKNGKIK